MLVGRMPAQAQRVRRRLAVRWCRRVRWDRHAHSQPRPGRMRNEQSRMSPSPQPIARPMIPARPSAAGHAEVSDKTLVDVAPPPGRSGSKSSGNRVVGLLVVRPCVLVRRVIRTGHPAAGQADHKARPVVIAVPPAQAVLAVLRLRPDLRKAVEVLASRGRPVWACSRRSHGQALAGDHGTLPLGDGNAGRARSTILESTPDGPGAETGNVSTAHHQNRSPAGRRRSVGGDRSG